MTFLDTDATSLAITNSLYAYGMAYKCEQDAKRSAEYGGSEALYLEYAARHWLEEARQWRRIADALP